jgi:hypothetical protein
MIILGMPVIRVGYRKNGRKFRKIDAKSTIDRKTSAVAVIFRKKLVFARDILVLLPNLGEQ